MIGSVDEMVVVGCFHHVGAVVGHVVGKVGDAVVGHVVVKIVAVVGHAAVKAVGCFRQTCFFLSFPSLPGRHQREPRSS